MLEVFKEAVAELPFKLEIVSVKERHSKYTLDVLYKGFGAVGCCTVDLNKTCAPGMQHDYCWSVIAIAMSTIYFYNQDYKRSKLWLDASNNKELVIKDGKCLG